MARTFMRFLGYLMISAPFVVLFLEAQERIGLAKTAMVFGALAALVAWISVAVSLIYPLPPKD